MPAEQLIRCLHPDCGYVRQMRLNGELATHCPGCQRPGHWLITLPEPPPLTWSFNDKQLLHRYGISTR